MDEMQHGMTGVVLGVIFFPDSAYFGPLCADLRGGCFFRARRGGEPCP